MLIPLPQRFIVISCSEIDKITKENCVLKIFQPQKLKEKPDEKSAFLYTLEQK